MKHLLFIIVLLIAFGCSTDRLDVKVDDITIKVQTKRFDQDLFQEEITLNRLQELQKVYPSFLPFFTQEVVPLAAPTNEGLIQNINSYITDAQILTIQQSIDSTFENWTVYESDIEQAFRFYAYHFPNRPIPQIITMNSGFNYGVLSLDSQLVLGLDMFLGEEYGFYKRLQFPLYKRQKQKPALLAVQALYGWVSSEFGELERGADMLSHMVYHGKHLYAMDAVFPKHADSLKIGFSPAQMQWCAENEFNMWAYFIKEDLLYTKDYTQIVKFVNEAPFTSAFGRQSPPKTARWVGWQIVRNYMNNNPQVSLSELMNNQDAKAILAQSKYKPTR